MNMLTLYKQYIFNIVREAINFTVADTQTDLSIRHIDKVYIQCDAIRSEQFKKKQSFLYAYNL